MLATDGRRQVGGQEAGQRDGAGLVGFRGTQDDAAPMSEKARRTSMRQRSKSMSHTRKAGLAPAQAGVAQQQDQQAADMTKTHCRTPDGRGPLPTDSRATQRVMSSKVILASDTVRQVGMMCWLISHWYWWRVFGFRSARDAGHASAWSPKVIWPSAGSVQSPYGEGQARGPALNASAEPPVLNQLSAESPFTTAGQCVAADRSCCGQNAFPLVCTCCGTATLRGVYHHTQCRQWLGHHMPHS